MSDEDRSYRITGLLQATPIGYIQRALDDSPAEDVQAFERVIRRARMAQEVNLSQDPLYNIGRRIADRKAGLE